ncbi:MAG: S9 family peptidase [Firmicutes bacterium]|nr:S9 family peptidase [Bacillota bacterium]
MGQENRFPRTEDFYDIEYVSTPDYCPAKNLLAYVLSQGTKRDYVQRVLVKDLATGKLQQMSAGGNVETSPRISPDGSKLLLCSNATGDPQVWVVDLTTGEKRRLTSMRYGATEPVWSPHGDKIAFIAGAPGTDAPDALQVMRDPGDVAREERERRRQPVAAEDYGYKSDENMGFARDVPPPHIWVIGLEDQHARCLTDGEKKHVMPVWAPDGKTILFASNREREAREFLGMDLFTVAVDSGEITRLTEDVLVAHYPKRIVPRYTPDGKQIVFGALVPNGEGLPPCYLYSIPAGGGKPVQLFGADAPCDGATRFLYNATRYGDVYETMQISEDSEFAYFISGWHGTGNVYRVKLDGTSSVEAVTSGQENYCSLSVPEENKSIVVKCDALHFEDIFLLDLGTGETEQLTRHNQWLEDVALSAMDEMWIDTLDGNSKVQGWVLKPQQAESGEKYPAVLYIHGGPTPFYGYALTYEFQCLAAQGIGVIMVNPRGSSGYGPEHGRISLAYDGSAYYDLLQFTSEAVRRFDWIDGERLGVCGGSYGGYMTNWIAGHSKRFKVAATHRSPVNNLISYASSDMGANGRAKQYASYEEFMLAELEKSPVTYSDKIDIPFLILHSTQDMRCPVEGAHQLYTAVKDQHPNLPVRMVLFPNSNHGLTMSGPMYLRIIHYNENIRWFKKYL